MQDSRSVWEPVMCFPAVESCPWRPAGWHRCLWALGADAAELLEHRLHFVSKLQRQIFGMICLFFVFWFFCKKKKKRVYNDEYISNLRGDSVNDPYYLLWSAEVQQRWMVSWVERIQRLTERRSFDRGLMQTRKTYLYFVVDPTTSNVVSGPSISMTLQRSLHLKKAVVSEWFKCNSHSWNRSSILFEIYRVTNNFLILHQHSDRRSCKGKTLRAEAQLTVWTEDLSKACWILSAKL